LWKVWGVGIFQPGRIGGFNPIWGKALGTQNLGQNLLEIASFKEFGEIIKPKFRLD